jgi:hypothetical protein
MPLATPHPTQPNPTQPQPTPSSCACSDSGSVGGWEAGSPTISLLLVCGRHARCDQSYDPIQTSLTAMLRAFAAPIAVRLDRGGLLVQGERRALVAWLGTAAGMAFVSMLGVAGNVSALPTSYLLDQDAQSEAQVCVKGLGGWGGGGVCLWELSGEFSAAVADARSAPV